jgi:hypothetical protein
MAEARTAKDRKTMTHEDQSDESLPRRIEARYVKSSTYRVVHADGVWGGPTPQGNIFMAPYAEHWTNPDSLVYEVAPGGRLTPERREVEQGITRELEVGIVMSLRTAKSLLEWLRGRIEQMERSEGRVTPPDTPIAEIVDEIELT